MIKSITKDILKDIKSCYQAQKPEHYIDIDETIYKQLSFALIDQSYVSIDEEITGFAIIYPYDNNIVLNPWFFGGLPIGQNQEERMNECLDYFKTSSYSRLEIIGIKDELQTKNIPIPFAYDYANLEKIIFGEHESIGEFIALKEVQEDLLKDIYHKAFLNGDAKFYQYQDEDEKKAFWKHLRYDLAVDDPCSIAIKLDDQVIGYVITYREGRKIGILVVCAFYLNTAVRAMALNY